ncbi:uncharacterized protein SAPINGB_P002947 [Magnusiomyces paraingens]|uniref:Golgi apparatus membrane protein TVP15 n=1 Tax=Magnusiomyces paraingens TaxID=2606893 RepID=A0A5E8BJ12_9ASCO|nr:uncharacterized protein SAPINGB_P002947 [Saprochaete ingens]VVT50989.1 unnamed protein product [Saprochaete ingens]
MPISLPQLGSFDLSIAFRLVNLVVGVLFILGGISQFFPVSFQSTIIGVYVIIFGLGLILLEFRVPPLTYSYASFLFSFVGRGIFYTFIGSLLLHDHVLRIVGGSVIIFIGVVYILLEFVASIQKPYSMITPNDGGYEDHTETL